MTLDDDAIRAGFDDAAGRYDLMVALNPGYHRHLATAAQALALRLRPGARRILDLGCGSGASTRALVDALGVRATELIGVDASEGMLACARGKSWPSGVRFVRASIGELDAVTTGGPADGALAAYLIRNVAADDRDKVLRLIRERLAPGSPFVVEEYSVTSRRARFVWTAVCWAVVIPLSLVTTRRSTLYRHLWRSVLDFDSVGRLQERFRSAGFVDVEARTVDGWQRGILHVVVGRTPA